MFILKFFDGGHSGTGSVNTPAPAVRPYRAFTCASFSVGEPSQVAMAGQYAEVFLYDGEGNVLTSWGLRYDDHAIVENANGNTVDRIRNQMWSGESSKAAPGGSPLLGSAYNRI